MPTLVRWAAFHPSKKVRPLSICKASDKSIHISVFETAYGTALWPKLPESPLKLSTRLAKSLL